MKNILVLSVILLLIMNKITCQTIPQNEVIVNPPYQMHSSIFVMVLFHLDADLLQPLMPEGMLLKANSEGKVTATFEMYTTDRIYGLENYSVAFVVVDVLNYNSENGTSGHYALWGSVNSKQVSNNFAQHFGLPFAFNQGVFLEVKDGVYSGKIKDSADGIVELEVLAKEQEPFHGSGIVNMIGVNEDNKISISEVPWLSSGYVGEVKRFNFETKDDTVLNLFNGAIPFWSMVSVNQIFCYSKPLVK